MAFGKHLHETVLGAAARVNERIASKCRRSQMTNKNPHIETRRCFSQAGSFFWGGGGGGGGIGTTMGSCFKPSRKVRFTNAPSDTQFIKLPTAE